MFGERSVFAGKIHTNRHMETLQCLERIERRYTYFNNINESLISMAMKKWPIQKQPCKEINDIW